MNLEEKLNKLEEIITGYGQMIVALSGGVDSTFLLTFAAEKFAEAGCPDNVAAITAVGPQFAEDESGFAERLCESLSVSHKKLDASHIIEQIKENPSDRCYHCKKALFSEMKAKADLVGSVLADGTNLDDLDDYRPGYKAIQELGVASPLKEAGLTKADIRQALAMTGIREASDKAEMPAFACLMTRIPFGEEITETKLRMIYAAEEYLKQRGFTQVRVRCHETAGGYLARIELNRDEMDRLNEIAAECEADFKGIGFRFVTLDLGGYEKGKMNAL
ncbi:MAG: ATP-dependent sacrificial sulfur transferase LarE [Clostridiales bacterium]|nr:ATP-dependent sacrificial sulfur transferase LarE [Clostridiales bacterium]